MHFLSVDRVLAKIWHVVLFILTMEVYVEVSECGRKNMTAVRSGTFMIVSLSSALIKGNPKLSYETKVVLQGQN